MYENTLSLKQLPGGTPGVYLRVDPPPRPALPPPPSIHHVTMDQKQVILQFRFPTFGDSMLQKMNLLRLQRRFCDVTVHVNELEVPGHKVVLAAGSSFLRDQFVLQQESGEVQISMSQEAEVGRRLLLSCYTGQLEFPELELVHYLTVASFLQMGHIVEQCTQALDKFIKPPRLPQHPMLMEAGEDDTGLDTGKMREESERRRRRRRRKEEEGFSSRPSCQQEQECCSQTHTVYQDEKVEQVEDDDCDDDDDDDDVIIQPKTPPPPPPTQSLRCIRRDAADSGITIVKVESVNDVASENSISAGYFLPSRSSSPPATAAAALHSPEQPQHSLINSTVDVTRAGDIAALPPHMSSSSFPLSPAPPRKQGGGGHPSGHPRGYDKPLQWYHQCPKCARVFRQLENYANHLKMHKLFMCLLCGKTFTQKGNLHRHMRVHAGIKPFQCKICGKTFTQKCSLLDHLNLHSGDKPHRCNYCDMVFAHKPVLRKHLKQIHGKTSFDNANERSGLHDGAGGTLEFEFGQAKPLCGLTPVLAPPTSHQVHSCSHQAQDLCVAPDSQHQTLHSGVVDS